MPDLPSCHAPLDGVSPFHSIVKISFTRLFSAYISVLYTDKHTKNGGNTQNETKYTQKHLYFKCILCNFNGQNT